MKHQGLQTAWLGVWNVLMIPLEGANTGLGKKGSLFSTGSVTALQTESSLWTEDWWNNVGWRKGLTKENNAEGQ